MKKATVSKLSFLSVMSLYLVYLGTAEISPALATLAQHFTGKNVTWISTVPSLFLVIGSLLAGAVLGKRITFSIPDHSGLFCSADCSKTA